MLPSKSATARRGATAAAQLNCASRARAETMHERIISVRTPAGEMETFITYPEEGGPFAPVLIYMDFWGVREELFDIARRVGTVGLTAWCRTSTTARDGSGMNGATRRTR